MVWKKFCSDYSETVDRLRRLLNATESSKADNQSSIPDAFTLQKKGKNGLVPLDKVKKVIKKITVLPRLLEVNYAISVLI